MINKYIDIVFFISIVIVLLFILLFNRTTKVVPIEPKPKIIVPDTPPVLPIPPVGPTPRPDEVIPHD